MGARERMRPLTKRLPEHDILPQFLVHGVGPPAIGHDIWDASSSSSFDQLALCIGGRREGHRNDEDLLAPECIYERLLVAIAYRYGLDALRQLVGAVCAGEGPHGVLAGLDELLGNVFAQCAAGLVETSVSAEGDQVMGDWWTGRRLTPTIATLSTRLTKPVGWSLAYFGVIRSVMRLCTQCI